jgi:hypothetical protein
MNEIQNDCYYSLHFFEDYITVADAIKETFKRRETVLPNITPTALTEAFSKDATKQMQWKAFLRKNRLHEKISLEYVARGIEEFLMPVIASIKSLKS